MWDLLIRFSTPLKKSPSKNPSRIAVSWSHWKGFFNHHEGIPSQTEEYLVDDENFAFTLFNSSGGSFVRLRLLGGSESAWATDDEFVTVGMHRAEVESVLRTGGSAYDEPNGHTRVRYQYSDGVHQGSKARILLYLAGDFFTLFLSELIFWPLELAVEQSAERAAEADYNETNRLDHFRAMKRRNQTEVINIGSGSYQLLPGAVKSVEAESENGEVAKPCTAMQRQRRKC